jgi:hypothetical protein
MTRAGEPTYILIRRQARPPVSLNFCVVLLNLIVVRRQMPSLY